MSQARQHVAVIDYGMGNLHSVASALSHVAADAHIEVTADAEVIARADRVVFPGVGAIRDCMAEIRRLGFDRMVARAISEKPVLAVCIGLQALMERSEENGGVDCLGILPGRVRFFGNDLHDEHGQRLKVPHMGWSPVAHSAAHPLWHGIASGTRFYFVHSYYVDASEHEQVVGRCQYGLEFAAALSKPNLFAAQFHPEKSHTAGLQLLSNFLEWDGHLA
jgi:glutamine amidotransferase